MLQEGAPEPISHLLVEICRLHYSRCHTMLEAIGLHRGQPPVLRALWDREGLTHSELAEKLHVQPPTITHMIRRMESAGFVEARPDPQDQRVSRVYLMEAGRAVQEDVQRVFRELEERTLMGFSREECVLLHRFFLRIRDNLLPGDGGRPATLASCACPTPADPTCQKE